MNSVSPTPQSARHFWRTIRRWVSSPLQRRYEWQFFSLFWRLRNQWDRLNFRFGKRAYSLRGGARIAAESTSIFFIIISTVFWQVLGAALLVAVLEFCDRKLRGPSTFLDWIARHSAKAQVLVIWLQQTLPDASLSAGTLSTLAQISVLFLGLYFTAISVVAGTNYSRVSAEILDALVREKVGNLYIRIVALFGGVSLMLLGASNLGFRPGILNLIVVSLLGIASVFSFVQLGQRAFYFFDPTKLVKFVARDILQAMRSSTWAGFRWRDPPFQDHYRKQADSEVRIYEDVILLSDNESHLQGRPLLALILQFLVLLEVYAEEKKRIPSDSSWFERTYRHRTWLTTEETKVNIAIETGTALEPEYVPDHSWFEKRIAGLISRTLKGLRDRNDFARVITVCTRLEDTLGIFGKELVIDESLLLFQHLKILAHEVAINTKLETGTSPDQVQTLAPALGLADVCGMGFISILLGFANRIESISPESFSACIDNVDFRRPKTMYQTGLPRKVVEELEYLYRGINFEVRVEGRQISPAWYCRQIAAWGMARFFVETCDTLLAELETTYAVEAEDLSTKKQYPFAAQVVQRGLEACHKFHLRIEKFRAWFKLFSELRRVPDIPWPEFDAKKAHERIESVRDRLLIVLANSVSGIAALPVSSDIPDYLGQAYVMLADECYKSLTSGDEPLFAKLFPPFFAISIAVQDRLRVQLKDKDTKTVLVYVTEPVEDLLAISGYALVYSELDNKNFWRVVKNYWENYFAKLADSAAVIKFLVGTISYRRTLFAILPRDLRRGAWAQDLMHRLRERGLADDLLGSRVLGMREQEPDHPSALIRTLARGSFLFEKAADIFMACYLMDRPEAAGLTPPSSVKDFATRLKRAVSAGGHETEASDETSQD
jgi:hypothetical protein